MLISRGNSKNIQEASLEMKSNQDGEIDVNNLQWKNSW